MFAFIKVIIKAELLKERTERYPDAPIHRLDDWGHRTASCDARLKKPWSEGIRTVGDSLDKNTGDTDSADRQGGHERIAGDLSPLATPEEVGQTPEWDTDDSCLALAPTLATAQQVFGNTDDIDRSPDNDVVPEQGQ